MTTALTPRPRPLVVTTRDGPERFVRAIRLARRGTLDQPGGVRIAALTAIAASVAASACSPSPIDRQELCESADTLIGTRLVVPSYDALTILEHAGEECGDGSCCNRATLAPTIRCADGPDILLVPADDLEPLHLHLIECQNFVDDARLLGGTSDATPCLASAGCPVHWLSASATVADEMRLDPIRGGPMRVLRVHELLSVPMR